MRTEALVIKLTIKIATEDHCHVTRPPSFAALADTHAISIQIMLSFEIKQNKTKMPLLLVHQSKNI